MKLAQLALAALAAGLLSSAAVAHGGRGGHGERFKAMDTNGDGNVTRAEAEASAKSRFAGRDKNADGKLSGDELPRWRRHHHGDDKDGTKDGADAGKDGERTFSQSDFVARALAHFDRLDANSDGVVTQEEFDAAKEKHRGHRGSH